MFMLWMVSIFFTFVLEYDDVREGIAYKREGGSHCLTLGCRLVFGLT